VIVDNTFATSHLCKPLEWGADLVVHSATKYICGHNDILAGVISGNDGALRQQLLEYRILVGSVLSPDDAARLLSYSWTLDIRLCRQNSGAAVIADFLNKHPAVSEVRYPGLKPGRQYDIATSMFGDKGFGAMLLFRIASGREGCQRLLDSLNGRIPHLGTLGHVETSILHIESSFLGGYPTDAFRLSVGIEDAAKTIKILKAALDTLLTQKNEQKILEEKP
jgi:cystathionine beta-lyase/cystathionine gamma-synthase